MADTNELLRADLRRDTELVADNIEVTKFPQMVHVTVDSMRRLIADADRLARAEELLQEIRDVEGGALLQGTADDIDAFLSGASDD